MDLVKSIVRRCGLLAFITLIVTLEIGCASVPVSNRTESGPYITIGTANFYGDNDGFEGTIMANGKIFHSSDPHIAAQQTLPLGTKVKVTDLENNKSIDVWITDRIGKATEGNIISLSVAASKALGLKDTSKIKVKIENNVAPVYKSCDPKPVVPIFIASIYPLLYI